MDREIRLSVIGILLTMFLAALDQTIVATAMPKIVSELQGLELYAWVTTAFLLATTVGLPLFGRLVELFAAKWVLLSAAVIFLVGSFLSGLSPNINALIAFRAVQGFGAGGIFAIVFTVVALLFPPRQRGKVQGVFGAVWGLSSVFGPWLGGLLTDHLSWRWVFYVNMPVGAVALYFLLVHMPRLDPQEKGRFDLPGFITLVLWSVPLMLAFSWGGSTYPWGSPRIVSLFILAAVGILLFYLAERRSPEPLFDLSLFQGRTFRWANLGMFFFGGAFPGAIAFLPLYLVQAKGFSATNSGLSLTPLTLSLAASSALSGQLASRVGRYKSILLASSLWTLAIFLGVHFNLSVETPVWEVILLMVLLGVGLGPSLPLYTLAVQNAVGLKRIGTASSAAQFSRQVGSTIGVALMGTVLASTIASEIPAHLPAAYRSQSAAFDTSEIRDTGAIRKGIESRFNSLYLQIEAAAKGDRQAYDALIQNPGVPKEVKDRLVPGGIPAAVHAQTEATVSQVERALNGDAQAKSALLQSPQTPYLLKAALQNPPERAAERAAIVDKTRQELTGREPEVVKAVEAEVLPQLKAELSLQAGQVADTVISAVNTGITAAVKDVYLYTALFSLLSFVAILGMPNLELQPDLNPAEGSGVHPA